ncbi:hypothetical protein KL936_001838 [Ogataea polymorpha]|nr:hypothetical protein KL936_001838 [Ogataea polymorpha]
MQIVKDLLDELFLWFCHLIIDTFFREVRVRGSYNLPSKGATLVVIAPHHNQFLDAAIVTHAIHKINGRRTLFIEAAASVRRPVIGQLSKWSGAIPVERAQDLLTNKQGKIRYADYSNDELTIVGEGTKFTQDCEVKGLIGLPESAGNQKIAEIISDTKLRLAKPMTKAKGIEMLIRGTAYKSAPKVDNHDVFKIVFQRLKEGELIGIASEGGSHDRTELLPLKPGVGIMALGTVAEYEGTEVNIVPCGMNYFHPHKFRSRAVLEFGEPIKVGPEEASAYKQDPRKTVDALMENITTALKSVTTQSPDLETLQVIQAARRLYSNPSRPLPLPLVVEMNRNLLIGYSKFKDDPKIQHLKESVTGYNKRLGYLGLKDYQVETVSKNRWRTLVLLTTRLVRLMVLLVLSLPGTVLFSPVFIACKVISKKKQKAALANSSVKIKAIDVLGSWKVLIALVAAPICYFIYSAIGTVLVFKYELVRYNSWNVLATFASWWILLVCTTYAAFVMGEVGMDIFKSIRPLILSLSPRSTDLDELRKERQRLSAEITEVINELGPKVFPKLDKHSLARLEKEYEAEVEELRSRSRSRSHSRSRSGSRSLSRASTQSGFTENTMPNLSDVSIFPDALQLRDQSSLSPTSSSSSFVHLDSADRISASGVNDHDASLLSKVRTAVLKKRNEEARLEGEKSG